GAHLRVIVGELDGAQSPVPIFSEMFYAELVLRKSYALKPQYSERAAYVAEGEVVVDGARFAAGEMAVLSPGIDVVLASEHGARVILLGGEPIGPRFMWWNFVSSSRGRIAQAADDWRNGRFPSVPGETEFIPLPDRAPPAVDYP
ncbi:MAG TPA: pirin-like C-terminal cupin domain-containing protein, partial [Burkholderiales bacterium]|nr:pirin-like C-terminal cupin domain-containing protein [Burkholderiales bacterium]